MGWSRGTEVMEAIVDAYEHVHPEVMDRVDFASKVEFYKRILSILTDQDWDNLDEVQGLSSSLDEALKPYLNEEE